MIYSPTQQIVGFEVINFPSFLILKFYFHPSEDFFLILILMSFKLIDLLNFLSLDTLLKSVQIFSEMLSVLF